MYIYIHIYIYTHIFIYLLDTFRYKISVLWHLLKRSRPATA